MFQIKVALIALGVLNALLVARPLAAVLDGMPAFAPLPARIRLAALRVAADLDLGGGLRAPHRLFLKPFGRSVA